MLFMLVYIWQVEVMSTDIRATAQGLANTVCRLAGLTVPVLTELGKTNSNYMYVPMLVINTLCLFTNLKLANLDCGHFLIDLPSLQDISIWDHPDLAVCSNSKRNQTTILFDNFINTLAQRCQSVNTQPSGAIFSYSVYRS